MSPKKWIESTNAIGIISKSGRYGGTYAHSDIAFEFASWISPEFKLYIIRDYKRLKSDETSRLSLNWNLNREISKLNYRIHTDAIKENLLPQELTAKQVSFTYADEADMLNVEDVAEIREYMQEKEQKQVEYRRTMQDIEEAKQYIDDYEDWREEAKKAGDSFYEAFDHFQADHDVSENDEEIFYRSVFQEFNEQWKGKSETVSKKKSEVTKGEKVDFSKLSLEERAKLLPPPIGDQMAELKEYQKRMGYDESKMKSMKYKMKVYDEFLKEYEYRKKHYGIRENVQKKRRDRER